MFSIMMFSKLKSGFALAAAEGHNSRTHETPNADPGRTHKNIWLKGRPDGGVDAVKARIGNRTVRKNGVLALEFMMTASPEYFRHDPDAYGVYDQWKVDRYNERAMAWLTKTFGDDNVISAVCHLDEATPHIHAVIVPISPDDRLSAKHYVDGRKKVSALQDSFAEAMRPLGLYRGIKGSNADHEKVSKYYGAITGGAPVFIPAPDIPRPPVMIMPKTRGKWADDQRLAAEKSQARAVEDIKAMAGKMEIERRKARAERFALARAIDAFEAEKRRQKWRLGLLDGYVDMIRPGEPAPEFAVKGIRKQLDALLGREPAQPPADPGHDTTSAPDPAANPAAPASIFDVFAPVRPVEPFSAAKPAYDGREPAQGDERADIAPVRPTLPVSDDSEDWHSPH